MNTPLFAACVGSFESVCGSAASYERIHASDSCPLGGSAPYFATNTLHAPITNPTPQAWGPPTTYVTDGGKLVCVMLGSSESGKAYIAERLSRYINFFYGTPTRVFRAGKHRGNNVSHAPSVITNREDGVRYTAQLALLDDLVYWMAPCRGDATCDDYTYRLGSVAIYDDDATTGTRESREWLVRRLTPTGAKIVFIELSFTNPRTEKFDRANANVV